MRKAVCLASGGLDSSVCLYLLARQNLSPVPVFIDYGQLNRDREFAALSRVCDDLRISEPVVFNFSSYSENIQSGLTTNDLHIVEDAFTPCRNLIFLVTAAAFAFSVSADKIVMGLLSEKNLLFPDQSETFIDSSRAAIAAALGIEIDILLPLRQFEKAEVEALANELGVRSYYSCHAGTEMPCGRCIACKEYERA